MPAAISNVTSENNGTSLRLSWQCPEGDVDAVVVTFFDNDTIVQETTQPGNATEVAAYKLTPGSAYQVEVMSVSGSLTNQSKLTVRTGEKKTEPNSLCLFFIPSSSSSCFCSTFSSGGGVTPPAVSFFYRPSANVGAPHWPLGELQGFPVGWHAAAGRHRTGPRCGEL